MSEQDHIMMAAAVTVIGILGGLLVLVKCVG